MSNHLSMKRIEKRFWPKVDKTGSCWIWIAMVHPDGYGRFRVGSKMMKSSRASWLINKGPLPDKDESYHGICVLHKCDNPLCVNPDHLFLGTHKQNMEDCKQKGRNKNTPRAGMKNELAKLTDRQVLEIRVLSGMMRQVDIALKYGIKQPNVSRIILRTAWRHI